MVVVRRAKQQVESLQDYDITLKFLGPVFTMAQYSCYFDVWKTSYNPYTIYYPYDIEQ